MHTQNQVLIDRFRVAGHLLLEWQIPVGVKATGIAWSEMQRSHTRFLMGSGRRLVQNRKSVFPGSSSSQHPLNLWRITLKQDRRDLNQ